MGSALPLGDPAPVDGSLPSDVSVSPDTAFSVYVHVPFCRVRCGYCDFNTYTATELRGARQDAYADEVLREVALSTRVLGERGGLRPAATVF
ncbi:MAG: coproporphyrinogen III oxidase, partial [Microbacterium sp.]